MPPILMPPPSTPMVATKRKLSDKSCDITVSQPDGQFSDVQKNLIPCSKSPRVIVELIQPVSTNFPSSISSYSDSISTAPNWTEIQKENSSSIADYSSDFNCKSNVVASTAAHLDYEEDESSSYDENETEDEGSIECDEMLDRRRNRKKKREHVSTRRRRLTSEKNCSAKQVPAATHFVNEPASIVSAASTNVVPLPPISTISSSLLAVSSPIPPLSSVSSSFISSAPSLFSTAFVSDLSSSITTSLRPVRVETNSICQRPSMPITSMASTTSSSNSSRIVECAENGKSYLQLGSDSNTMNTGSNGDSTGDMKNNNTGTLFPWTSSVPVQTLQHVVSSSISCSVEASVGQSFSDPPLTSSPPQQSNSSITTSSYYLPLLSNSVQISQLNSEPPPLIFSQHRLASYNSNSDSGVQHHHPHSSFSDEGRGVEDGARVGLPSLDSSPHVIQGSNHIDLSSNVHIPSLISSPFFRYSTSSSISNPPSSPIILCDHSTLCLQKHRGGERISSSATSQSMQVSLQEKSKSSNILPPLFCYRQTRARMLNLSLHKLQISRQNHHEGCLRKSVAICNLLRKIEGETDEDNCRLNELIYSQHQQNLEQQQHCLPIIQPVTHSRLVSTPPPHIIPSLLNTNNFQQSTLTTKEDGGNTEDVDECFYESDDILQDENDMNNLEEEEREDFENGDLTEDDDDESLTDSSEGSDDSGICSTDSSSAQSHISPQSSSNLNDSSNSKLLPIQIENST